MLTGRDHFFIAGGIFFISRGRRRFFRLTRRVSENTSSLAAPIPEKHGQSRS